MTRLLLVLLLVVVAGLSVPAAPLAETSDLAGVYLCEGVNPEGKPYKGIVEIVQADGFYHVRWTFPPADERQIGFGMLTHGVLAVSYYGGSTAGLVIYAIEAGKPLVGEWVTPGVEGVHAETLTKLPGDHAPVLREEPKPAPRTIGDPSKRVQA
jgi:hypothetical protein